MTRRPGRRAGGRAIVREIGREGLEAFQEFRRIRVDPRVERKGGGIRMVRYRVSLSAGLRGSA